MTVLVFSILIMLITLVSLVFLFLNLPYCIIGYLVYRPIWLVSVFRFYRISCTDLLLPFIHILMHPYSYIHTFTQDRSVCDIAHRLSDCDVLLTPHGFQSMLLLFLPRPALLFEVFPYRYYKRGYGPLGGEYGVR